MLREKTRSAVLMALPLIREARRSTYAGVVMRKRRTCVLLNQPLIFEVKENCTYALRKRNEENVEDKEERGINLFPK